MKILIALDCTELQVSDCDHLVLSAYRWWRDNRGYYRCSNCDIWNGYQINGKPIHWFVSQLMGLKIPKGYQIDHIDRNKLNNRRSNLRAASNKLQSYNVNITKTNTSGYVGVNFKKGRTINPWVARISMPNDERKHLGYFKTPEEASKKYQAEKKIRDEKEIERCKAI